MLALDISLTARSTATRGWGSGSCRRLRRGRRWRYSAHSCRPLATGRLRLEQILDATQYVVAKPLGVGFFAMRQIGEEYQRGHGSLVRAPGAVGVLLRLEPAQGTYRLFGGLIATMITKQLGTFAGLRGSLRCGMTMGLGIGKTRRSLFRQWCRLIRGNHRWFMALAGVKSTCFSCSGSGGGSPFKSSFSFSTRPDP